MYYISLRSTYWTEELTSISLKATSQALPNPAIKGAGNVPLLNPRSCPPPLICGSTRTRGRRRTYKAPIPTEKTRNSQLTLNFVILQKFALNL